jgi:hypothetical protein
MLLFISRQPFLLELLLTIEFESTPYFWNGQGEGLDSTYKESPTTLPYNSKMYGESIHVKIPIANMT